MATTYKWKVIALYCKPSYEGKTNVIETVHWRCDANDGTFNASTYSTCNLEYDTESEFIEYADLTEEQIFEWVWSHGVDQDATQTNLDSQLELLVNPPIITPILPWINTSNVA